MKKALIWILVAVFAFSLSFIGAGCKTTAAETTAATATEEKLAEKEEIEEAGKEAEAEAAATEKASGEYQTAGSKFYEREELETAKDAILAQTFDRKLKIAHFWCIATCPYAATAVPTVKDFIEEAGHEHVIFDANLDAALQANQVDDAIAMKVDGMIIFPQDSQAIVPSLEKAFNAGIPVLISYAKIPEDAMKYTIGYAGPDDWLAGSKAAELMNEVLGGKGKVAILEGAAGQEQVKLRTQGFTEKLAELGSEIEIVARQTTEWDKNNATKVVEDWIIRYPDLDGIFAQDDVIGAGGGIAMREAGLTEDDIVIVGYGGSKDGLSAIQDGLIYGTHMQSAVISGTLEALKILEYFYNDMELPQQLDPYFNFQPMPMVTKENVEDFLPGEW